LSFLYLREYDEEDTAQFQPVSDISPFQEMNSNSFISEDDLDDRQSIKKAGLNNIQVFIAADKFEIISLKSLATDKFSRWATANWNHPVFPEVMQEVMTSVPSHEADLRETIVDIMAAHVFDVIKIPKILQAMDSFGLGSLVIAKLVINRQVKRPNEHENFPELVQNLNSRHSCRHYSTEFNVKLKKGEYLYGGFRCAVCNTRH
jgi:hypothetical protein